jgi:GH18 family chitinase
MKTLFPALWGVLLAVLAGCGEDDKQGTTNLPGAPVEVMAQAADGWALLTWGAPETDGGTPLLYYMVRCEPRCAGAIVSAGQRQATVPGLNNGISYAFMVSAVNKVGEGPASAAAEPVTPRSGAEITNPAAPARPRQLRATPGNGQVYLSWLAPDSPGGQPLRGYRVTTHPGGASVRVDAPASSALIDGLENGKAYAFTVVATNGVGDSPPAFTLPVRLSPGGPPARWVSGYWVGYGRSFLPPEEVDFSGLTHLLVGRFNPHPETGVVEPEEEWQLPESWVHDTAKTLSSRAHQAGRKVLLMLGGYEGHDEQGNLKPLPLVKAASDELRPTLVRSILEHMDRLGYDGVDLDWEPINLADGDGEKLLALIDELRAARPGILITVPVFAWNSNLGMPGDMAAFVPKLAARVDQLNLMSYAQSYNQPGWESWHSSALGDATPEHPSSVAASVQMYLDAGVPAERLGVGIGFFGQCWRGVTEPRVPLAGRTGVAQEKSDNHMSYANIVTQYYEADARRWDERAQVPYLSFPFAKGKERCNFISYEDSQSIVAKGRYVRRKGLGGAMIWNLHQGYLYGAPEGQRHPLSAALKRAFLDP